MTTGRDLAVECSPLMKHRFALSNAGQLVQRIQRYLVLGAAALAWMARKCGLYDPLFF